MENLIAPDRLDIKALAHSGGELAGRDRLWGFKRVVADLPVEAPDGVVDWAVRAEWRATAAGQGEAWLHLRVNAALPLVCQRCLGPVALPIVIDRWFRFVANEDLAEAQDDEAQEDLLVMSREFNLAELIEDELLLDWPVVPRHDICPVPVQLEVVDPGFNAPETARPHPFAVLAKLQGGKSR